MATGFIPSGLLQGAPQPASQSIWQRIGGLLGAQGATPDEQEQLGRQGLLYAGLGILANNNQNGSVGAALGSGITSGLLAAGNQRLQQQKLDRSLQAPSEFRALDLAARAAGYEPGTQGYKDFFKRNNGEIARQSSAAIQYKEVVGPDGRTRIVALDPRDVGAQTVGGGASYGSMAGSVPGTTRFTGPDGQAVQIGDDLPPEVRQSILNNTASWNAAPDGASAQLPDQTTFTPRPAYQRPSSSAGQNPFASRTPEEQAALTEAAKRQVELSTLPRELDMRTKAAIRQAGGEAAATAAAKAEADRSAQDATRSRDSSTVLDLLDEAEQILPQATGSLIGRGRDAASAAFGRSTPGAQATAQLQAIAGQLTSKMPRMEGPQSDRDVELYQQMAGDLANASLPVETRQAAARTIRELNQKYATPQRAASPAPSGVDELLSKYGIK